MVKSARSPRYYFILVAFIGAIFLNPHLALASSVSPNVITTTGNTITWTVSDPGASEADYEIYYPDGTEYIYCSVAGCGNPWVFTDDQYGPPFPQGTYHFLALPSHCNTDYATCAPSATTDLTLCYDNTGNACMGGGGGMGSTTPSSASELTPDDKLFMYGVTLFFLSIIGWGVIFRPFQIT